MTDTGHNSKAVLQSLVERIERLETEKREVAEQIKRVYAEAKGNGFDASVMRKVISRRRKPADELEEEDHLLSLYELAMAGDAEAASTLAVLQS